MTRRTSARRIGSALRAGLDRWPGTLRARLALYAALAAFGCLTIAGMVVFVATARLLGHQSESQLRQVAGVTAPVAQLSTDGVLQTLCRTLSNSSTQRADASIVAPTEVVVQLVRPDGTTCRPLGGTQIHQVSTAPWPLRWLLGTDLPHGHGDHGEQLLVLRQPLKSGWQLWIARDLSRDLDVLIKLRGVMFGLSVIGGLVALGAGLIIARRGLRPVASLAEAAERIARTQDLSVRIDVPDRGERDEVTRLARSFDRMMAALAASRHRQNQLIADASHELRTPLTSLRTNIDLLLRSERSGRAIPPTQREALFTDVRRQLEELSELAGELTVLAHEDAPDGGRPLLPVRLDEVVQAAVRRVRPRAGERRIELTIEPWLLPEADSIGLERAVVNLLDNAIKFSPAASTIRVALADGTLTVDDEGPGVPAEQRREAFARFWRGEQARALPGSGLGLAIVADAVSRHHGTVALEPVPDRAAGTRAVVTLPGHAVDQDQPAPHSDAGAGVPLP